MKKSICHYSFHRLWKAENWTPKKLAEKIKALGVEGIDFHAGLVGPSKDAPGKIQTALKKSGLILSGLSLSNDFCKDDPEEFRKQIDTVKEWLEVADAVKAPVSRIFGGNVSDRGNAEALSLARQKVLDGLGEVVQEAEKYGIVLALENHGGMPCTGEEQVNIIETIGSKFLRATIDVGNYMQGGQEGHVGTHIAAKYVAYVHFKDFRKKPTPLKPWGWDIEPCTVGKGDVDHYACLQALKEVGYKGFIALEYEGPDEESIGVPESVKFMNEVMKEFS